MLDLRTTLKRHEFARIGDGPSSTRAIPFFYRGIVGTNPAHRIDIITGHPDHHDWYLRIYDGNRKICHDRHFHSQEDALAAAWAIHSEADATELRLRKIERWPGDNAYTVDGLASADVLVTEIKPNEWWFQVVDDNVGRLQWNGPWSSAEEAFLVYRFHFRKAN